ncbi:MAG TPA: hypothetical protein VN704_11225 [Verrucomicrobiae bacterium]|nr:hypothetical protein [Verrucomicrobiae bacterium]
MIQKVIVFWITSRMRSIKREQLNDKLIVINLFENNYARDLFLIFSIVDIRSRSLEII